jgi:hypothetical protein
MLKSEYTAYCHRRQVPRIHLRNRLAAEIEVKGETMRRKLLGKSSGGVPFLMCLLAVLTIGQGIEAQEDPASKKRASSEAQKGAVLVCARKTMEEI